MKTFTPQDPAPWAAKIIALKQADPFQAFSVFMTSNHVIAVNRPENVEITDTGSCAKVFVSDGSDRRLTHVLSLDWVIDIVVGGEVGAPPRPPRFVSKLRSLQTQGPHGPMVLTLHDGRQIPVAGPHQFLLSIDGRSVALCEPDGGLLIVETCDITDLSPRA